MSAERRSSRGLLPLYVVVFTGFVGYSLMTTVFTPLFLQGDAGGMLEASAGTGRRTVVLGVLLALYPLGQFLGSPVLGALSDRLGRRPVLLASLVASTLMYGAIAVALAAGSLPLLLAAVFAAGLGEANTHVRGDVGARERRRPPRLHGCVHQPGASSPTGACAPTTSSTSRSTWRCSASSASIRCIWWTSSGWA